MTRCLLVGCGARKLDHAAPARELYVGSLTRARIQHAEAAGRPWAIVSAKHGVVLPDAIVDPYDLPLSSLTSDERRAWGQRVVMELHTCRGVEAGDTIELHTSQLYADAIAGHAVGASLRVETPMSGLGIGHQLGWYRQQRERRARAALLHSWQVPA